MMNVGRQDHGTERGARINARIIKERKEKKIGGKGCGAGAFYSSVSTI